MKSNLPGPFVHKRPAGTAAPAGQSRRSLTPAGSRASARRCPSRDKGSSSAPVQQAATNYNNAFKKKKTRQTILKHNETKRNGYLQND